MFDYPIVVHDEAGHFWSSCPDIPEAHSAGDSLEELLANAVEGLELALSIYVDQRRTIPLPSALKPGQHLVKLPVATAAKIALWNKLTEDGLSKADLAAGLGLSHTAASRLVDFEHNSKIEQVEAALASLGLRLAVSVEPAVSFEAEQARRQLGADREAARRSLGGQ